MTIFIIILSSVILGLNLWLFLLISGIQDIDFWTGKKRDE